jgi:hypothetical protein
VTTAIPSFSDPFSGGEVETPMEASATFPPNVC